MAQLRTYQIDDKRAILQAWKEYRSVLYQLPTGGGKSVILSSIIEDIKDKKIIVFAHKKKLIRQLQNHLSSRGIDCGVMMGSLSENLESNIIIASIRSAVKDARLQMLIDREWDYEIIDEARHSRTGSYDKVLEEIFHNYPNARLLGVDATPYRKDKKRLDKHFQHLVVSNETTASLMEKGYLQKCKTIVSPIDLEKLQEEVKETTGDYQIQSLSNYMRKPKFLEYVVSQYIQYGEQRQNIVFAVDIAHAKDLQAVFEDNGFEGKVARIDSTMSDAVIEQTFADFESKKIQILINVEMVTEGVDLPIAGCITGARPTKSLTLYLQMAGRGARPDDENDYFILLDCCGWTEEYGVVSAPKTWSLNPEIDPNSGRIGHKIFGKKANGELTEDLDDFIGEIIEMSPEEYLQTLVGGKEQAEKINISIDDKIQALFQEIIKLLAKLLKELAAAPNFDISFESGDYRDSTIIWTHKDRDPDDSRWNVNRVTLTLAIGENPKVSLDSTNQRKQLAYFQTLEFAGKLGGGIVLKSQDGKLVGLIELAEQIEQLKKQKIDLDQFRKAEEQIAADKRQNEIEEHARLEKIFPLNKAIDWSTVFPRDYQSDVKITAIEVPSGKINNHHNTLILHNHRETWNYESRKYEKVEGSEHKIEKNYVKGEKVLEMIEDGKWNIEVENKK